MKAFIIAEVLSDLASWGSQVRPTRGALSAIIGGIAGHFVGHGGLGAAQDAPMASMRTISMTVSRWTKAAPATIGSATMVGIDEDC